MFAKFLNLASKDLRLVFLSGNGFVQALLLGFLLIFVFSIAGSKGAESHPRWIAAIFWLATSFSLVLIFNNLFALEEENETRQGLLIAPVPLQSIWLGKTIAGALLLLLVQLLFLPAEIVFLNISQASSWQGILLLIPLVDWGLVVLGSLLGGIASGENSRDSLLTIIIFPLLLPLLLAGIKIGEALLSSGGGEQIYSWYTIVIAFDLIFTGAALILFPFVFSE